MAFKGLNGLTVFTLHRSGGFERTNFHNIHLKGFIFNNFHIGVVVMKGLILYNFHFVRMRWS